MLIRLALIIAVVLLGGPAVALAETTKKCEAEARGYTFSAVLHCSELPIELPDSGPEVVANIDEPEAVVDDFARDWAVWCALQRRQFAGIPGSPDPCPADIETAALQAAAEVVETMNVPAPAAKVGPNMGQLGVNVPLWLSIIDPGSVSATATVATLSISATATVTSLTWNMGEPVDPAKPSGRTNSFTCAGLGQAPPTQPKVTDTPPCGYTYSWMSTKERTNGTGAWPVTITAHWTVNWSANTGASGQLALESTTATSLEIGEWRAVLTPPR
jgi:hypothetical protein